MLKTTPKSSWTASPALWRRLVFALIALALFRLSKAIPLPMVAPSMFSYATLFAIGFLPFVTALLYGHLIKLILPPLAKWEQSSRTNSRYYRLGITLLALFLSMRQSGELAIAIQTTALSIWANDLSFVIALVASSVAGTALTIWLSDRITESGLGNGTLVLWAATVLMSRSFGIKDTYKAWSNSGISNTELFEILAFFIASALILVFAMMAQKKGKNFAAKSVLSVGEEHEALDFVWPSVLSVFATLPAKHLLETITPATFVDEHFLNFGHGASIALFAILLILFWWLQLRMRNRVSEKSVQTARLIWPVILAQLLVCASSEWVIYRLHSPLGVVGSTTILLVAAAASVFDSIRKTQN